MENSPNKGKEVWDVKKLLEVWKWDWNCFFNLQIIFFTYRFGYLLLFVFLSNSAQTWLTMPPPCVWHTCSLTRILMRAHWDWPMWLPLKLTHWAVSAQNVRTHDILANSYYLLYSWTHLCLYLSLMCPVVAYYPSHSVKKPSYLNTGLTSTKNYGKTILTKVCFSFCCWCFFSLDVMQHVMLSAWHAFLCGCCE